MNRRSLLAAAAMFAVLPGGRRSATAASDDVFLVTNHGTDTVGFVDAATGRMTELVAGAAPWGIALSSSRRAYVSTAEGVAAIDLTVRSRRFLAPYRSWSGEPSFGEYRPGGMGIAVSPDGSRVYTGVYLPDGPSVVEVLDVKTRAVVGTAQCGTRPFQLIASRDGSAVYAIDHDSYTVTVVDTETLATTTLPASPLGDANGLGGFEKPHYGALDDDGRLLLPVQGQVLLRLDPRTGASSTDRLAANTHQHGVARSPDGRRLAIVGTGPAGAATAGPSLAIVDVSSGEEAVHPLDRPHENCAWSADGARIYLTGGYTFGGGGWDGLTVVDAATGDATEWAVGSLPQDIVRLP